MSFSIRKMRGTVIAYFLVMISVLTTGLLTTMAFTTGEQSQVAGQTTKRDQAFYAAEAGVQRAYWLLQQNASWRADPATGTSLLTGTLGNATYSVSCVGPWNSAVLITSAGTLGSGTTSVTVTAAATPIVIVPAITLGSNFDNSGNVTINGDVQTVGNIVTTGSLTEKNSLYAGGTITTSGSVSITGTSNPNYTPTPTVPAIDTALLISQATSIINVGSNPHTPHTVTASELQQLGSGGILYFKGAAGIIFKGNNNFTGFGTIITDGDVTIQGAASVGTSASPALLNIVCGGNLDISGYLGIVGSIYVPNGGITKSGGLDITGVIVGGGDLTTNGGLTVNIAQPPPWDPRNAMPANMVLKRITGPIF